MRATAALVPLVAAQLARCRPHVDGNLLAQGTVWLTDHVQSAGHCCCDTVEIGEGCASKPRASSVPGELTTTTGTALSHLSRLAALDTRKTLWLPLYLNVITWPTEAVYDCGSDGIAFQKDCSLPMRSSDDPEPTKGVVAGGDGDDVAAAILTFAHETKKDMYRSYTWSVRVVGLPLFPLGGG